MSRKRALRISEAQHEAAKILAPLAVALVTFSTPRLAVAGSLSAPGATDGLAVYAPVPEGLYLINIATVGTRNTTPNTVTDFYDPFFFLQTKYKIANAGISFIVAPTVFNVNNGPTHLTGIYNTYIGSQLTWDLGNGLGAGYRLAGYVPQRGPVAYDFGAIEQRFGFSYTGQGFNVTANFQYGNTFTDRATGLYVQPDYLNLDLTATKKFGKYEFGVVGYGSTDLSRAFVGYKRQSQFAAGILLGYDFGPLVVQLKPSIDVAQRNYGGYDKRLFGNVIFPLWSPASPAAQERAIEKRS